jgi:predicted PurR-regulated permease PerM
MTQPTGAISVRNAVEIAVYLLLIFAILAWCFQIVAPFIPFLLWGAVIAVALYPAFLKLRQSVGGRNKLAVLIFVLLGLSIIILPAWMLGGSLIDSAQRFGHSLQSGEFHLPPPGDQVKEWPLVGEKLYTSWSAAASNLGGWLEANNEQVEAVVSGLLHRAAGIGLAVVQFLAATLIAAAMLANDTVTKAMIQRLARRLVGERADEFLKLTTATIRSVAMGVLGVAFIQAVAGGIGMTLAGVPGAGLWALFILILAIAQLPPLLVLLPAIFYVFSVGDSTTVAIIFTIWSVLVSFSDTLLKPLLLGRGVEAPMLVILLGAIGGMLYAGIIGLFLGAVVLALGYKMFQAWLQWAEKERPEET